MMKNRFGFGLQRAREELTALAQETLGDRRCPNVQVYINADGVQLRAHPGAASDIARFEFGGEHDPIEDAMDWLRAERLLYQVPSLTGWDSDESWALGRQNAAHDGEA